MSLAALKAFQDVLSTGTKINSGSEATDGNNDEFIWNLAWKAWLSIGTQATTPPKDVRLTHIPSQPFLTALVLIFPGLFNHIKTRFVSLFHLFRLRNWIITVLLMSLDLVQTICVCYALFSSLVWVFRFTVKLRPSSCRRSTIPCWLRYKKGSYYAWILYKGLVSFFVFVC